MTIEGSDGAAAWAWVAVATAPSVSRLRATAARRRVRVNIGNSLGLGEDQLVTVSRKWLTSAAQAASSAGKLSLPPASTKPSLARQPATQSRTAWDTSALR